MVVGIEDRLLIECRQDALLLADFADHSSVDGARAIYDAANSLTTRAPEEFPFPLSLIVDLSVVPDPDAVVRNILEDVMISGISEDVRQLGALLLQQANPYQTT